MSEATKTLRAMAKVYEAGAKKSRGWVYNNNRQQDADVYDAMADEAYFQADLLEMEES